MKKKTRSIREKEKTTFFVEMSRPWTRPRHAARSRLSRRRRAPEQMCASFREEMITSIDCMTY